jgi:hypothetical protein
MTDRLAWVATAAASGLTPQRLWLERLAWIVPGPAMNRWLLLADVACLLAIAFARQRPPFAVPIALGVGFLGLNVFGMVLTDFYLGMVVTHVAAGATALIFAGRWRWVGALTLVLALALGLLT